MDALSAQERLIGFICLWTEIKYGFANFDLVPEVNWEETLAEYLPRVQREQSTADYYRVLQECTAKLKDGHTAVFAPGGRMFGDAPPISIASIEGKAVVISGTIGEEMKAAGLTLGTEITHVDGRSVADVLREDIYPYLSASTPQGRDCTAYRKLLEGLEGSLVTVRACRPDGMSVEMKLPRVSYGAAYPNLNPVEYRNLDQGLGYLALNSFGSEDVVSQFDVLFDKILLADGLIIDMRANFGGNSSYGESIIARLIDRPLPSTHWRTRQYRPSFRAWGQPEEWYEAEPRMIEPQGDCPYTGPIVALIGPDTYSAAEDFLAVVHAAKRTTLVGRKTGGSTGQPLMIDLPGDGHARICTKRDTYPDGREFVGVGVIPDVEIAPTQDDVAARRDIVLMKGIEVLRAALV